MNLPIQKRIHLLRKQLEMQHLQACIIPTSDPHQSEYTADCWKFREYLSGFTGSAGTLVVGIHRAALWTDSRYFLQAENELRNSQIQLFKSGMPETPGPEQWIIDEGYLSVGIDGSVFSAKEALSFSEFFGQKGVKLETGFEPYEKVWPERPGFPKGEIYHYPDTFSGETVKNKTERLLAKIAQTGAECMPLAALDEIAWLFNLRGEDVDFNPVGTCYAFIGKEEIVLFADSFKLKAETLAYLQKDGIKVSAYESLPAYLKHLHKEKILLDKSQINYKLYQNIPVDCTIIEGHSPVAWMKAIKNPVEMDGFRKAMIKDGLALTRFWMWMEKAIDPSEKNGLPDEWVIGEKLAEFRRNQDYYVCESFCPIVGFNEHGAIVHYEATPESAFTVCKEGFLLIDTGGQYMDGTTDITRSWSFYENTPACYKEDYTSLLKGVIALSTASFPTGTRGTQLDALARQFIWKRSINFGHGTGHGVGHFLNVHEGPQSIRMNENPATLEAGMVLSNEPGIYRGGKYGIRIENLMLVREKETSDFGQFLTFETLTLLPFDLRSIEKNKLSTEEISWINNYHQTVYERLAPGLNETECQWLKEKTKQI
ncbi:MAG: aminopeptidase family protein P [Bacteroidales bacterium]|nr:aminopeptidase family protein P [Bacteroidales bacterium]